MLTEMIERLEKARTQLVEQKKEDPSDAIRQKILDDGIEDVKKWHLNGLESSY